MEKKIKTEIPIRKLIALLLLLPTMASATIGSSESECVTKYGANLGGVHPNYEVYASFKSGIKINAFLMRGKVVRINYTGNITPSRRLGIMKMNGRNWTKVGQTVWRCGGAEAKILPNYISITNAGYTPPRKQAPIRVDARRKPITRRMVGGG